MSFKEKYLPLIKKYNFLKLEYIFLITFMLFGMAFITTTPPGQNPDEAPHVFRIWQFSEGNLLSDINPTTEEVGGMIPDGVMDVFRVAGSVPDNSFDTSYKFNNIDYERLRNNEINSEEAFQKFPGSALYSPTAYSTLIPTVWLGNLLNLPFIYTLYLMRIVSLITLAILLFLSIRIIPFGKWAIFTVSLLPSTVAQGAAITADGAIIGIGILLLSYTLKIALSDTKPSLLNSIFIFIMISFIAMAKTTYAPLALLVLLIPAFNKKARDRKSISVILLPVIFAATLSIAWLKLTSYVGHNGGPNTNDTLQIEYLLSSPFNFVPIMYETFFTTKTFSLTGLFGNFGWKTAPLPDIILILLTASVVLATLINSGRDKSLNKYNIETLRLYRLILLATFSVIIFGISLSLYIYFAPLGNDTITGIQGRYFIPLLPLILLAFYGNRVRDQRAVKIFIATVLLASLFVAIYTAYSRYYIH